MNKNMLFPGFLILLLIGGAAFILLQTQTKKTTSEQTQMTTKQQSEQSAEVVMGYQGEQLAGRTAPYLAFTKADYEKAQQENKVIFLDFYANWCPICRAEAPEIQAGFDELPSEKVVGFRVNYNDTETDPDEKALAEQYGVTYQHTKVIVKDGKQVLKTQDQWDKETLVKEINKHL